MIKKNRKKSIISIILVSMIVMCMYGCTRGTNTPSESETIETPAVTETAVASSEEKTSGPETVPSTENENFSTENYAGHKIIIASDIHYLSPSLTDGGESFTYMIEHGDGRIVQYSTQILDEFVEEVISQKPEVLILSGDLTFNGEQQSHIELADILGDIERSGIPVIVIPGNHDINNPAARRYEGNTTIPEININADEFSEIYSDYGYDEAISRDMSSLSYIWRLSDDTRIMMIDDNIYDPSNKVGGMIQEGTYAWMDEQFEEAYDDGAQVITVSHHNMLDESEVYVDDCTIEHSEKAVSMLEGWGVPVHLSGHLHVQHYKESSDDSDAIYEIVTGSLTTPPCCYGVLYIDAYGSYHYEAKEMDMSKWAASQSTYYEDLINWSRFKDSFLEKVFINQAYAEYDNLGIADTLSEEDKLSMAQMYARLNIEYYAGRAYMVADEISKSDDYAKWEDSGYKSKFIDYIDYIIRDAGQDYNILDVKR